MPTYEYACKKCGEHLEVQQSFTDDPLTKCPNCGGKLRKVFGSIGISFKGSGFYKNDSRKSGGKSSTVSASSDSSTTASSSDSSSSTSSDSKSDSKSESKSDSKSDGKKSDTKKSEAKAAASS